MNAMNQFDNRMKKNNGPFGAAGDSSSDDEPKGARRPLSEVDIEK